MLAVPRPLPRHCRVLLHGLRTPAVICATVAQVRTFSIDGSIQMKSYLTGSPELQLALNDELVIAGSGVKVLAHAWRSRG